MLSTLSSVACTLKIDKYIKNLLIKIKNFEIIIIKKILKITK